MLVDLLVVQVYRAVLREEATVTGKDQEVGSNDREDEVYGLEKVC